MLTVEEIVRLAFVWYGDKIGEPLRFSLRTDLTIHNQGTREYEPMSLYQAGLVTGRGTFTQFEFATSKPSGRIVSATASDVVAMLEMVGLEDTLLGLCYGKEMPWTFGWAPNCHMFFGDEW